MLRQSFARIAGVALVFFALPALLAVIAERGIASLPSEPGPTQTFIALSAVAAAVSLRVLGPVAFAGFLDEAVAKEYLHGGHHTLGQVLRSLPWRRLIVADVIVVIVVGIGLELFAIPGLIAFGGLGLVGVVIVQERDGLANSFRRTVSLALSVPGLVALLVVAPFAFEQIVHELVLHELETSGLGIQLIAEWLLAVVLGGTLGLLEVALATELIARNPRSATVDDPALLDDGQAPAV
jgi:hypothetical protein